MGLDEHEGMGEQVVVLYVVITYIYDSVWHAVVASLTSVST